jgi:hypothetical protein
MTLLPIPLKSNPAFHPIGGEPKVFNAYGVLGGEDRKSVSSLIPCGGLKSFGSDTEGVCRGLIYIEEETTLFTINGIRIFKFNSAGTKTEVGLLTGDEPVIWARNDADTVQTVIISDGRAYKLTDATLGYLNNVLPDDGIPLGVTLVGGYFLIWKADGKMYTSDLNSMTFQPLNFATAESDPDGLTACIGIQNKLYAIGTKSTEVWQIDGTTGFPLSRISGASIDFGSLSKHTVKEIDNKVLFVASDNTVRVVSGYQEQSVSTDEISSLIEAESDKNDLIAFVHTRNDNKFYCLQGTDWTRELNIKTGFWHNRFTDTENQWKALHHARAWGRDIFGDRLNGDLHEGDYTIYTESGAPMTWGFQTTQIHAQPNALEFLGAHFDMETGHSALNDEAFVMWKWSDDNGRTWKGERQLSLGNQGEYTRRVKTGHMGTCKPNGRVFWLGISDPVVRALNEIDIKANVVAMS